MDSRSLGTILCLVCSVALAGVEPVNLDTKTKAVTNPTFKLGLNQFYFNGTLLETQLSGLPSMSGNSGKILTTNGTSASWSTLASAGAVTLSGAQNITGAKTILFANPIWTFTDTAGIGGSGAVSFTYGLNTGHSVMAWGPNFGIHFSGPYALDGVNGGAGWVTESNWIVTGDGSAFSQTGSNQHETYWTDDGNHRVIMGIRNTTNGVAQIAVRGNFDVDGTATAMRNVSGQPIISGKDNQAFTAELWLHNTNGTSHGADIHIGGTDATTGGWQIYNDPAQNGTDQFGIWNNYVGGYPFLVTKSNNRVGINHAIGDTLATALDVSGALTLGGTAGAGFIDLVAQSSPPSAPSSGHIRIFDTSANKFGWIGASGFVRTFDGTLSASRIYTLPDYAITFAGLDAAQTFTAAQAFNGNNGAVNVGSFELGANGAVFRVRNNIGSVNIIAADLSGTTSRLGFFNVTPVIQQTGNVVTALSNYGLVTSGTISGSNVSGGTFGAVDGSALTSLNPGAMGGVNVVTGQFGGTGVNNSGHTLTLAGAGALTLTAGGTYNFTIPATGTAVLAGTDTSITSLTGLTGTVGSATGYKIRDSSAAFDVTLAATSSSTLTAGRALTFDMGNVAHTIALGTTTGTVTFVNNSLVPANGGTGITSLGAGVATAFGNATNSAGGLVTYGGGWTTKTTTYTAVSGDKILANTSGGSFTITLPASPSVGDNVYAVDAQGSFSTHALTVGRNSQSIAGAASDLTASTDSEAFQLIFAGGSMGWQVVRFQ